MKNAIKKELELICRKNGGLLLPEQVVEHARRKTSVLHDRFEWDDTIAGEQYRLWQARVLIRVVVTVEPSSQESVRAYVSLRNEYGKGYRAIAQVMNDKEMTAQLLQDALEDLEYFKQKYNKLRELSTLESVFNAIDSMLTQPRRKKRA